MTNKELRDYLASFKKEHGTEVRLSVLVREFQGFKPIYKPRQEAKDTKAADAARKAAIGRAITNLYNALLEAHVNSRLTLHGPEGHVDFSQVSEYHDGGPIGSKTLPDSLVTLDEKFFDFTQSLGYTLGGPKGSAVVRTNEADDLVRALEQLQKSKNPDAKAFVSEYKRVQEKLKLPKLS